MSATYRKRGKAWLVTVHEDSQRKYTTVHSEAEARDLVKTLSLGKLAELTLRETFQQVAGRRQPVVENGAAAPFPTLREALPAWIEQCERRGELRGSSPIGYRSACATWLYPTLGDVPVNEITRKMIGAVIGRIKDAGRSRSTIGHVRNPLKTYFADLIETERLEVNPAADLKHFIGKKKAVAKVKDSDYFTQEEGPTLLQTAKGAYPRAYAYIATALLLGLRRGEAAALYVSDIDWRAKRVHVQRSFNDQTHRVGPTKTGKDRWVDANDEVLGILKAQIEVVKLEAQVKGWSAEQRRLLFPNTEGRMLLRGPFATRVWEPLLKKAGLPYRKFHALRHTFAVWMLNEGAPPQEVQQQMGHSSIAITVDVYGAFQKARHEAYVGRIGQYAGVTA